MSKLTKRAASFAAHSAIFSRFVGLLEQADSGHPNLLRVLTYHRVDEPDAHLGLDPSLISATPEAFDRQMGYLAANYQVISMPELLDSFMHQDGARLPPRAVMVTFDDAYCDFVENAWPILQRYRLPVTLFVPTAFPDQPERTFWWDRLYQAVSNAERRDHIDTPLARLPITLNGERVPTFKQLKGYVKALPHDEAMAWVEQICVELESPHPTHRVLSWDALRHLASSGVTLGAHTQTHPLMNRISPQEARSEAVGSLRDLKREIGSVLPIFAYPGGGFNQEVVRDLEGEGFVTAFTTVRGINNLLAADRLQLRRINVGSRTTLPTLRAQLLPWSVYLNRFVRG